MKGLSRIIKSSGWKIYWTKYPYSSWTTCGLLDNTDRETIETLKNKCLLERLRPKYYNNYYAPMKKIYANN